MVEDATKVLEDVADELWVPWAGRLIPTIVRRVREETEARAREEAKRVVDEKLARVAKRDRRLEEKLTAVLESWMSQAEEMVEAEGSEAIGMEELGMTGGTQSSAMEVDEEGEDEVVVVEEVK